MKHNRFSELRRAHSSCGQVLFGFSHLTRPQTDQTRIVALHFQRTCSSNNQNPLFLPAPHTPAAEVCLAGFPNCTFPPLCWCFPKLRGGRGTDPPFARTWARKNLLPCNSCDPCRPRSSSSANK